MVRNGIRLHVLECGSGSGPTVILEAGMCASSLNFRELQRRIAAFAPVIAYDRAGLGWSDDPPVAPTPIHLAQELRQLLQNADVPPPYLLVAHSFGSFVAHRFADLFPECTAGVVLLDPLVPSDWIPLSKKRKQQLAWAVTGSRRAASMARFGLIRLAVWVVGLALRLRRNVTGNSVAPRGPDWLARIAEQMVKIPRELWPQIISHWLKPGFFKTTVAYLQLVPESTREMAQFKPLTGMPVTVLTGELNGNREDGAIRKIAPECRHVRALDSGHWVHLDEPDLVVEAIQEMMEEVRNGS